MAAVSATALLAGTAVRAADLPPITIPVILPQSGGGAFLGATQQKTLQILQDSVNASGGIKGRPAEIPVPRRHHQPGRREATRRARANALADRARLVALRDVQSDRTDVRDRRPGELLPLARDLSEQRLVRLLHKRQHEGSADRHRAFLPRKRLEKVRVCSPRKTPRAKTASTTLPKRSRTREQPACSSSIRERYGAQDVTATAQLTNIKSKNPQALIIWAPGTQFGTALRNVSDSASISRS